MKKTSLFSTDFLAAVAALAKLSERKVSKFFCPTFCTLQKVGKELLGRAKSCRWQVFVRRRPPKQGELRTDVSKATMFQGDRRWPTAAKDLILFVRSCCSGALNRGLRKPRISLQGSTILFFSLVRKEPKVPQRVATLWTPGERFKALPKKISAKFSGGTSRNRFFAQNRGEKALNRCEVRVLQRKDLERTAKEQPCSLVDSRLWLSGNLRVS